MDSRFLTLLVVVLLAVPTPLGSAQSASPSLEMPEPLLDLQRDWMEDAFADANETLRTVDLNVTERRAIQGTMERVRDLHEAGRHQAVLSNLVNLRGLTRYFEIEAEAERRNDTKGVFLNATVPAYVAAGNAAEALRANLNETQRDVDRARAFEVLYLSASTQVQGAEQRRLYPTYRGILQAQGPPPPDRLLQRAVQYSIAANWTIRYAADLHDLAVSVDEAGTGPKLNHSLVPVAQAFVAQRVAKQEVPGGSSQQGLQRLRDQMNASARRGNHVLSMALGGVYISSVIHSSVLNQLEQGNLRQDQVQSILRQASGNMTPLRATLDAGYYGILQKDAHKLVDEAIEDPRVTNGTLARAVARLDTARIIGQALHPLAIQSNDTQAAPSGGPSTSDILVAVGGGVALGAAAAVLGRRYLRK